MATTSPPSTVTGAPAASTNRTVSTPRHSVKSTVGPGWKATTGGEVALKKAEDLGVGIAEAHDPLDTVGEKVDVSGAERASAKEAAEGGQPSGGRE